MSVKFQLVFARLTWQNCVIWTKQNCFLNEPTIHNTKDSKTVAFLHLASICVMKLQLTVLDGLRFVDSTIIHRYNMYIGKIHDNIEFRSIFIS